MSKEFTIYHNPRCSKSRATLALLEENGVKPNIVEYLKTPLTKEGLQNLFTKLGLNAHDVLRKREDAYKHEGLSENSATEDIINAIIKHPILLERPVVVSDNKAVLGRPPENVLSLLPKK